MFTLDFQAGFSGRWIEFYPLAKVAAASGGRRRGDRHGELGGGPWHRGRDRAAQRDHQARITDHVGRENCRELTVDAFFRHE